MENDVKKEVVPDPAAPPGGSGSIIALVIAVGVLVVGLLYYQSRPKEPAMSVAPPPQQPGTPISMPSTPTPPAPQNPSPPAPPPPEAKPPAPSAPPAAPPAAESPDAGQLPVSATGGRMDPGLMMNGILLLEGSKYPLTPDQSRKILAAEEVHDGVPVHPALKRAHYLNALVGQILTNGQKDFLNRQRELDYVVIGPGQCHAVEAELVNISGLPPPSALMPTPARNYPRQDFIEPLVAYFDAMKAQPATRLTQQQAARLLPIMHTYNASPSDSAGLWLSYLTDKQKEYIDDHIPDLTASSGQGNDVDAKFRALLRKRAAR